MFSLDPLGLLSGSEEKEDPNDVGLLPVEHRGIYQNPYLIMALEDTASVAEIRMAYRKQCLAKISFFTGIAQSKSTFLQYTLAYHLCRKTIKGNPKTIKEALEHSAYFDDIRPDDILPLLKPMTSHHVECPKEYRGFRQLAISFVSSKLEFGNATKDSKSVTLTPTGSMAGTMGVLNSFVQTAFTFDVHYCLRKHTITKSYQECIIMKEEFSKELLVIPYFPEMPLLGIFDPNLGQTLGEGLSLFFNRIHKMVANKGMFSPTLLYFLDIPFERVQTEEEGRIVEILDTAVKPKDTVSHIISEDWLKRWRSFVMGRGARRYKPPGPIRNETLLEKYKLEHMDSLHRSLKLCIHYRSVNYNVWIFYQLVHGGGPSLSRREDDIYSLPAFSFPQAVIKCQSVIRMFLAKCSRSHLYTLELSKTDAAIELITETSKHCVQDSVDEILRLQKERLKKEKLDEVSKKTVSIWRSKKHFEPEISLVKRKKDQEVFSRASVNNATKDGVIIVPDYQPIVHIANTSIYSRRILEADGLKFALTNIPGTEMAAISKSKDEGLVDGSKILSINGLPTSSLSYLQVKDVLKEANWPICLTLERPQSKNALPDIDDFVQKDFKQRITVYADVKEGKVVDIPEVDFKCSLDKELGRLIVTSPSNADFSGMDYCLTGLAVKTINKVPWCKSTPQKDLDLLLGKQTSRFSRPKTLKVEFEEIVPSVRKDSVKVSYVKLLLQLGLNFLRHPNKGGSSYISTLKMSGTQLFYKKKEDPTKTEKELWESIPLYSIKFVIEGYHSSFFQKKGSNFDQLASFEIVTEEGDSIFYEMLTKKDEEEILFKDFTNEEIVRNRYDMSTAKEASIHRKAIKEKYDKEQAGKPEAEKKRFQLESVEENRLRRHRLNELIVGAFKAVVNEIRSSKVFLGPDGIPKRRLTAKTVLKKSDGGGLFS